MNANIDGSEHIRVIVVWRKFGDLGSFRFFLKSSNARLVSGNDKVSVPFRRNICDIVIHADSRS